MNEQLSLTDIVRSPVPETFIFLLATHENATCTCRGGSCHQLITPQGTAGRTQVGDLPWATNSSQQTRELTRGTSIFPRRTPGPVPWLSRSRHDSFMIQKKCSPPTPAHSGAAEIFRTCRQLLDPQCGGSPRPYTSVQFFVAL